MTASRSERPSASRRPEDDSRRTGAMMRTDFAGGSVQSRALELALRSTVKVALRVWAPTWRLPWPVGLVDHAGRLLRTVSGVTYEPVMLPHCRAELVCPPRATSGRFVLYLHGGGFHVGGRHLHRQMVGRFVQLLGTPVLQVNYRKLPRHSITSSIEDCLDAYRHILELGVDPARLIVMGDSAGGYLAFMTALGIREAGLPMPAALVAMSPFTDWDHTLKCAAPTAQTCAVFPRSAPEPLLAAATKCNRDERLISPARCDLTGLPPTLIQASSTEFLYPDAVLMADQLDAHGVPCELQVWNQQVHVFQAAAAVVPEAAQAVAEVVRFIDGVLPPSSDEPTMRCRPA